jgi:hypothetical protein
MVFLAIGWHNDFKAFSLSESSKPRTAHGSNVINE